MTVIDAVIIAATVTLVGGSVIGFVRWLVKAGLDDLLDRLDVRVEKHITPITDELAAVKADLAAVKAELSPNGGSSVKDKVNRLADNILTPERDT